MSKAMKATVLKTEEEIRDFIGGHRGEIRGLYEDKYWRNGGWNGTMDALCEVAKRHHAEIDTEELDDGVFEAIIQDEL